MPRDGAWWLSEMQFYPIDIICEKCERGAVFDGRQMMAEIGEIAMPELLDRLAARLGCKKVGTHMWNDRCMVYYRVNAEQLTGVKPKPGGAKIGDLPQWKNLSAICVACQKRTPLDRRAIERRYGAQVDPREIAERLTCSACGNATGNRIEITNQPR